MKHSVLKNISLNFVMQGITCLFSFLTVMYATRTLQPPAYGKVAFAANIAGYFIMLSSLGMPVYAMRCCAESARSGNDHGDGDSRQRLSAVWNELWSIQVLLSILAVAAFALCITVMPTLRKEALLLGICGSGILFHLLGCQWLYKALEEYRFLTLSLLICKVLSLLAIIIFIHSPQQYFEYALLSVLAGYGSDLLCFFRLRRYVDVSFRLRINLSHIRPLVIFSLMSGAVYIYNSLDMTMLGFMKTDYETGLYSLATKGKTVLTMLGGLVWTAALPAATALWKEGKREQFASLAARSLVAVTFLQAVAMVVCYILAPVLIRILGGEGYLEAVPAFRILLFTLVPIGASNILGGQVLIPAGREKTLLFAEILGAVFNFTANLFLIPRYSIEGAAFTTVIAEVIVWVVCLVAVKRELGLELLITPLRKTCRWLMRRLTLLRVHLEDRLFKEKLPYYCPCCDTYLRHFTDGGFADRPDRYDPRRYAGRDQRLLCPVCGSMPRHRILAAYLESDTDLRSGRLSLLHFAQERSMKRWLDRHNIPCTTADLYAPADLKLDLQAIALPDEYCDRIICNHVLEHVPDYRAALKELRRILRPGGVLYISFPVDPALPTVIEDASVTSAQERIERFGQYDHLRVFGRDSAAILESFGFQVTEISGDTCDPRILPLVGPADYDSNVLYRCTIMGSDPLTGDEQNVNKI